MFERGVAIGLDGFNNTMEEDHGYIYINIGLWSLIHVYCIVAAWIASRKGKALKYCATLEKINQRMLHLGKEDDESNDMQRLILKKEEENLLTKWEQKKRKSRFALLQSRSSSLTSVSEESVDYNAYAVICYTIDEGEDKSEHECTSEAETCDDDLCVWPQCSKTKKMPTKWRLLYTAYHTDEPMCSSGLTVERKRCRNWNDQRQKKEEDEKRKKDRTDSQNDSGIACGTRYGVRKLQYVVKKENQESGSKQLQKTWVDERSQTLIWWEDLLNTSKKEVSGMKGEEIPNFETIWQYAFDVFDLDENGVVSRKELADLVAPNAENRSGRTGEVLYNLLQSEFATEDGNIRQDVWMQLYKKLLRDHGNPSAHMVRAMWQDIKRVKETNPEKKKNEKFYGSFTAEPVCANAGQGHFKGQFEPVLSKETQFPTTAQINSSSSGGGTGKKSRKGKRHKASTVAPSNESTPPTNISNQ